MIELLGLFYEVAKGASDYISWDEGTKVVDREWLEQSGFGQLMRDKGFALYWSRPEQIETRKLEGYEVIFEIDKLRRVRRRIEWRSGDSLVLLGRRQQDDKRDA